MSDYGDEHYCTRCGAVLEEQPGFDPDDNYWICTECGQALYGEVDEDALYGDVLWCCDGCGAILNKQPGFSDYLSSWICTECGYSNDIDEDDIYESEEEYQRFKNSMYDEDDEDEDDNDEEDETEPEKVTRDYQSSSNSNDQKASEKQTKKKPKQNSFFRCHWKSIFCITLVPTIAFCGFILLYLWSRLIPIGISSDEAGSYDYETIMADLKNAGFAKIYACGVEDLSLEDEDKTGIVSEISVDGTTVFESDDKFDYNKTIYVYYHELELFCLPIASKKCNGENYEDVVSEIEEAGFVNVKTEADYDLTLGLLTKDGAVESVSVNGDTEYSTDTRYRPDVEIIVTYHTFKRNKQE